MSSSASQPPAPATARPVNTPPPRLERKAAQQQQRRPGRLPKLRQDTGFFAPVEPVGELMGAHETSPVRFSSPARRGARGGGKGGQHRPEGWGRVHRW